MKIYKKLTKRNYRDYEKEFIKLKHTRLQDFVQKMTASGEVLPEEADFSPKSLISVWKYAYPKIEMVSPVPNYPDGQIPIWFYIHEKRVHTDERGYTIYSLWLIDALVYYFGEVFIKNNEGLRWEAFYQLGSRLDYQYKPVINGLKNNYIYPFYQIFTSAVKTWIEDEEVSSKLSDTNLFDLYNYLIGLG